MVRAKFVYSFKNENFIGLNAVYTGSEENEKFFKYTPGGQIFLNVVNNEAADQFELGKEYYIDFTKCE